MTHEQIRDVLPDVVNATLGSEHRVQIEDHLRSCLECASEMRVLQMVKGAPSFAPMIDAVKVSSNIPPYGGIPAERPRPNTRVWQMLAAVAAVILVAVTVLSRGSQEVRGPSALPTQVAAVPATAAPVPSAAITRSDSPARSRVTSAPKPRELQVAVGLDDLSDGSVARLASELDALDVLPSAEPENLGVADPNAASGGEQ